LRSFLASPPDERRQIVEELQHYPAAQQYVGRVLEIANTCNNF
jgi:hemophore-related protein